MAGKDSLRPPWKPGESGNPDGSSRKQREKPLLRAAMNVLLGEPLSALERRRWAALSEGGRREAARQLKDIDHARAAALRLADMLLFGTPEISLKAFGVAAGLEPKLVEVSGGLEMPSTSHNYVPSEDEQQALRNEISGNGHDTSETLQ